MSKEIDAFKEIWYGNKTKENYDTVIDALKALDEIRNMNVIHTVKSGSIHMVTIPSSTLYVSVAKYSLLDKYFKKGDK